MLFWSIIVVVAILAIYLFIRLGGFKLIGNILEAIFDGISDIL